MADIVQADLVKETTATQGVGAYSLAGATAPFRSFVAAITTGKSCWYIVSDAANYEVGLGTVTAGAPDTMSRDLVVASSNGGAAVNWGVGNKDVRLCLPADVVGSIIQDLRVITAGAALTLRDNGVMLLADAVGGAFTQNLPAGATVFKGYTIALKKTDTSANAATFDGSGAETIEGALTLAATVQNQTIILVWGGAEWKVLLNSASALITSSDATTAAGPTYTRHRDSASPAAADYIGEDKYDGEDSAGNQTTYARLVAQILDPANGAETGRLLVGYLKDGAEVLSQLASASALKGFISGMVVTNNGADANNDLDISPGVCVFSDGSGFGRTTATFTKRMDAVFAKGSGNGGRGVAMPASGTFHVFLITEDATGDEDFYGDTSFAGANKPANWTLRKRAGSVLTNATPAFIALDVIEIGGGAVECLHSIPTLDINDTATGTAAKTATILVPADVKFDAICNVFCDSVALRVYVSSLDVDDAAPSATAAPLATFGIGSAAGTNSMCRVRVNTASQIRYRAAGNGDFLLSTLGWADSRRT